MKTANIPSVRLNRVFTPFSRPLSFHWLMPSPFAPVERGKGPRRSARLSRRSASASLPSLNIA